MLFFLADKDVNRSRIVTELSVNHSTDSSILCRWFENTHYLPV